jgi:hypothetical protein
LEEGPLLATVFAKLLNQLAVQEYYKVLNLPSGIKLHNPKNTQQRINFAISSKDLARIEVLDAAA